MHGADIGVALDGDADRVVLVCEKGDLIDGDQLMATIADLWKKDGRLAGNGLVATVMSNLGLERYVGARGLALVRTQVGDRYVLERMRADGFNLGGEQSGHIIMTDHATTGDGLMAALTRSPPRRCGNWAPRSSPSATNPMASTSMRNAARPRPRR